MAQDKKSSTNTDKEQTLDSSLQEQINSLQTQLTDVKTAMDSGIPMDYALRRKAVESAGELSDKYRYVHVRSFASEEELNRGSANQNTRWHHIRPDSVLVCGMGFHWSAEGYSWNKVCNMIEYAQSKGYYVGFSELQDRCFEPYDALGTMRNEAILMAQNEGFEWILYLDNDVMPEPDTLVRMIERQYPILAPMVVEPGTGRQLFAPGVTPNSGVVAGKWTVLSMLLFRTSVFRCVGPNFWRDAVGADEGFHFQHLWYYGHRPYIDSDIQLIVAGTPHYPLSSNRLSRADREEMWNKINEKRNRPPNRLPLDPNGPSVVDGEYMPWGTPPEDGFGQDNQVGPETRMVTLEELAEMDVAEDGMISMESLKSQSKE